MIIMSRNTDLSVILSVRGYSETEPVMNNAYIVVDPAIMMGKPVVRGTRITVEYILEKLACGEAVEDILKAHPRLSREMVLAAVDYAAKVLKSDIVYSPVA